MPICYLYKCEKCGKSKEVYHGMEDKPVVVCRCGKPMVRVVAQVAPPIMRGTKTPLRGK